MILQSYGDYENALKFMEKSLELNKTYVLFSYKLIKNRFFFLVFMEQKVLKSLYLIIYVHVFNHVEEIFDQH